jgi:hypothetical protein
MRKSKIKIGKKVHKWAKSAKQENAVKLLEDQTIEKKMIKFWPINSKGILQERRRPL